MSEPTPSSTASLYTSSLPTLSAWDAGSAGSLDGLKDGLGSSDREHRENRIGNSEVDTVRASDVLAVDPALVSEQVSQPLVVRSLNEVAGEKESREEAEGWVEMREETVCEGEGLSSELNTDLVDWSEGAGAAGSSAKKKVTYYLSETLQNQLKVRALIEGQAMSEVVEQALRFYLEHGEIVKRGGVGHTHRLYACPACQSMLMFRHGNLQSVPQTLATGAVLRDTDTVANLH